MKRKLPTLGVVGAYTGIVLKDFAEIHAVFDAFYPGIMQLGMCDRAQSLRGRLLSMLPELAKYDELCRQGQFVQAATDALAEFGDTIEIETGDAS